MSSAFKRPESVLVIVATAESEVLLLCRREPADFWQSVTGSLEWGETPVAAARRELREEAGLAADAGLEDTGMVNEYPIVPPWTAKYAPDVTHNREHVFLLRLQNLAAVELNSGEHVAYRWLPAVEAVALASSATDRAAIRRLTQAE